MKTVYFPSCKIQAALPLAAARLTEYMTKKQGLTLAGCCKEDFLKLEPSDTAVVICNSCAFQLGSNILKNPAFEGEHLKMDYALRYIAEDPDFVFPDYSGKHYVLSHCRYGYGEVPMDRYVRQILDKMHVDYEELPETVPAGLSFEEHEAYVQKLVKDHPQKDFITYCNPCRRYIAGAGKNVRHIIELVFETAERE